jgi:hypothetical protein
MLLKKIMEAILYHHDIPDDRQDDIEEAIHKLLDADLTRPSNLPKILLSYIQHGQGQARLPGDAQKVADWIEEKRQPRKVVPPLRHHTIHNLERATETYQARNRVYGNNYKRFGPIMESLYPNGITLKTPMEFNRFGVIIQLISKLSRYVTDPMFGHMDSVHDMGVYSMMLEELDAEQRGLDITSPVPLITMIGDATSVLPRSCLHVYQYPCQRNIGVNAAVASAAAKLNMCGTEHVCGKLRCINCGEKPETGE